jgi:Secretion system C-terminal sorting domain
LVGSSNSYSDRSNFDGLIVKTNAKGQAIWLNAIDFGDQGDNFINGIAPLKDGGCILTGYYKPALTEDVFSNYSTFIARLDGNGQMLWHKIIRPAGAKYGASSNGLLSTKDGHFLMFGETVLPNNSSDDYYLKFDENGNVFWQQYSLIDTVASRPIAGIATSDGGFIFVGENRRLSPEYNYYIEKIDANGIKIWNRPYLSEKYIYMNTIAQSPDGHFLVGGDAKSEDLQASPPYNLAFMYFTPDGTKLWEKYPVIEQSKALTLNHIIPAAEGGFFSVGEVFRDDYDAFLLKLNKTGEVEWGRIYGLKNNERASRALCPVPNQLWLWGNNGYAPPYYDAQALLFRTDLNGKLLVGTEQASATPEAKVLVYPNPGRDNVHVNIQSVQTIEELKWQLSDPRGVVVRRGESNLSDFDLNVQGLSTGVYYLIFGQMSLPVKKIVIID